MESIAVSPSADVNNGLVSLVEASEIVAGDLLKNEIVSAPQLSDTVSKIHGENQELSWEKITAEVAEDEDEVTQPADQLVINESSSAQLDLINSGIETTEAMMEVSQELKESGKPAESSFSDEMDTVAEEVTSHTETAKLPEEVIEEPQTASHIAEDAVGVSIEESSFTITNEETTEGEKSDIIEIQQEEVTDFHEIQDEANMEFNSVQHEEHNETLMETDPIVDVSQSSLEEELIHDDHVLEMSTKDVHEDVAAFKSEDVAVVEGVEYTVVEADEVETHETIEEHLAQTSSAASLTTETVVIINPDQTQTEITIEQIDDDKSEYSEEVYYIDQTNESVDDPLDGNEDIPKPKPKKPRGRKPITDIPLHVLGRDISKPTEGVSNGGRTMPKPRLGVKVPYRNLTSQIVSKQDIEKEIMERFKVKQEQNNANSGDVMFARRLTQRLAKKLIPVDKENAEKKNLQSTSSSSASLNSTQEIQDNSDLLAILEGEDDVVPSPKQQFGKKEMSKETEREIALKQLSELPNLSPTPEKKFFKSRDEENRKKENEIKKDAAQAEDTAETSSNEIVRTEKSKMENTNSEPKEVATKAETSKEKSKTETNEKAKQDGPSSKIPQKITHITKLTDKKSLAELEPRLKTGTVLKTYTRKRKSTETELPILPQKKPVVVVTNLRHEEDKPVVYVTKSSRVIKKKVIWDPDDEIPFRSPVRSTTRGDVRPVGRPPKEEKKNDQLNAKKNIEKKSEATVSKSVGRPTEKKIEQDKSPEKKLKKELQSPKSSAPKRWRRLTEIDRLLMDEGAVNMLYDVNTTEEMLQGKKKSAKPTINLDKAHKELMSKTDVIKNELLQHHTSSKDGQITLRKKEGPSPAKKEVFLPKKDISSPNLQRKKSKDSTRSTPPASPGYNAAEASRIIRRHSSSSFSSGDELTLEGIKRKSSAIEQPPRKKTKKTDAGKQQTTKDVSKNNNNSVDDAKVNNVEKSLSQNKDFMLTKRNKHATIKLLSTDGNYFLTEPLLKQLILTLKELGKDDECHVVSIISDSKDCFCDGLNYSQIVDESESILKKKATELAALVKEFLRCLLHFPKVLVAGIQGACVGLGVTMLPLFDMVIASDNSTFRTPYAKLGCIPEAGFLLTVPFLNSHGLAGELLYSCQTVEADDACRKGLVTKLCWPEKYQEEYRSLINSLTNKSCQSIVATKQQLRQHILDSTEAALNPINKLLVENWTSAECQTNFAK